MEGGGSAANGGDDENDDDAKLAGCELDGGDAEGSTKLSTELADVTLSIEPRRPNRTLASFSALADDSLIEFARETPFCFFFLERFFDLDSSVS